MKRFTGLSLAAAMGSALLLSVALPGVSRAASFGAVAGVAENAVTQVEQVQMRARGARVGGGGRVAGGRVGGGGGRRFGGGGGGYRGGRGAGIAAGIAGAAILGGIIAESQRGAYYDDQYYYGGSPYYGAPVYEEPVYVQPRRYYRRYDNYPRNPVRDPAGGGVMR